MSQDLELINAVASDLRFIAGTWGTQVDDDSLRRGSVQLRMLLVEGLLQRAWKAAGFGREPIIKAPKLEPLLASNKDIEFAVAGGGNYEGVQGAFAILNRDSNQQLILQTRILNLPSASDALASHAVSSQMVFA
jgi:hypothetical protein